MSSAAASSIDFLTSNLSQPGANRKRRKEGNGRNTRDVGGNITLGVTPNPDTERNEAEKQRSQEEAGGDAEDDDFATSKGQPPVDNEMTDETLIDEILNCDKNEHKKILGVENLVIVRKKDDKDGSKYRYDKEAKILDAFWDRGELIHPKVSNHKDAAEAFKSKLILQFY